MTVLDLIKILQTHDPAATVVVPTYNDRADVANALGLQIGGVREVKLRAIHVKASRFAPPRGVQRYEIEGDGEINGVEIG
ncbi:MAG TPA: hypothetical protein DCP03_19710 [Polaromonas sp.]|uniref:hypothetical protein n=1 Tax=Polaromonas sp. UBA4122 TaxID=1947074 RepID=UPI000EB98630|nr:hypothetical protein [Polaromonas sp. UBA4122]HAL40204.1 hypothetical protein [Polaromonas sp.]